MAKNGTDELFGGTMDYRPETRTYVTKLPMEGAPNGVIENQTTHPTGNPELGKAAAMFYMIRSAVQFAPESDKTMWQERLAEAEIAMRIQQAKDDIAYFTSVKDNPDSSPDDVASANNRIMGSEDTLASLYGKQMMAEERGSWLSAATPIPTQLPAEPTEPVTEGEQTDA